MDFYGYMRPNGKAGARNYVLLLPVNRSLNFIASNVERMTRNTRHFEIPAETGRTEVDREVIARTLIGLMNNANVGGIVLLAVAVGLVLLGLSLRDMWLRKRKLASEYPEDQPS